MSKILSFLREHRLVAEMIAVLIICFAIVLAVFVRMVVDDIEVTALQKSLSPDQTNLSETIPDGMPIVITVDPDGSEGGESTAVETTVSSPLLNVASNGTASSEDAEFAFGVIPLDVEEVEEEEIVEEPQINYYVGEGFMEDGSPVMVPEEPTEYLPIDQYWTQRMKVAHDLAEERRALGFGEDDEIIIDCRNTWTQEKQNLDIMAKVLTNECGSCPWQQILDTGICLIHRTQRENWPDMIYECVMQPGQYSPTYANGYYANSSARCYAAAVMLFDGLYDIPNNVVYQANFSQGDGVWRKAYVNTGNFASTTYFCYDVDWAKRLGY